MDQRDVSLLLVTTILYSVCISILLYSGILTERRPLLWCLMNAVTTREVTQAQQLLFVHLKQWPYTFPPSVG